MDSISDKTSLVNPQTVKSPRGRSKEDLQAWIVTGGKPDQVARWKTELAALDVLERQAAATINPGGADMTDTTSQADIDEIRRAISVICQPEQVVELRAISVSTPKKTYPHTVSGYYNDMEALARDAAKVAVYAKTTYITLNPVNQALLARAVNRCRAIVDKDPTTADGDTLRRLWLPIDTDPTRPADISSTDAEHNTALALAGTIAEDLQGMGWPQPAKGDSGNGGHLLYRIDLPRDDGGLVQRVLQALAFWYDTPTIKIDLTVYNPARIWKFYGTRTGKGDNMTGIAGMEDRPHRLARLLEVPDKIEIVSIELLQALVDRVPQPKVEPKKTYRGGKEQSLDVAAWIAEHGIETRGPMPWNGGQKWILKVCPWDSSHTDKSAWIIQLSGGAIDAGCKHNGCNGKAWEDLRELYEPGYKERREKKSGKKKEKPAPSSQEILDKLDKAESFNLTDYGNAQRLVSQHGQDIRYCPQWDAWLIFTGRRWEPDQTGEIMRRAKATALSIYHEIADELDEEARKDLLAWAKASQFESRLNAMISLARSEPGIPVIPDELDADHMLFNCQNGTLDLQTGQLRAHDRRDLITKIAPVNYDPGAKYPAWDKFQLDITAGDLEMIAFKRRAWGYTLTGDTSEQCLFFAYGSGANGKSTELETMRAAMGDYGQQADFSMFLAKQNERISNDLARTKGARFISAIEAGENRRLDEVGIKQVTGQDTVTARFLYKEYFEFKPQFKLWLAANHKPTIRGTDNAIWRRIRLIPYTVTIPPEKRDKKLPTKLRAELAGILAWAVQGCLEWQRDGLHPPEKVIEATEGYRREMDILAAFLAEYCQEDDGKGGIFITSANDLYTAYKQWAGDGSMTQQSFGLRLGEKGFEKKRESTTGRTIYKGIRLMSVRKTEAEDPSPEGPEGPEPLSTQLSHNPLRVTTSLKSPSGPSGPSGSPDNGQADKANLDDMLDALGGFAPGPNPYDREK